MIFSNLFKPKYKNKDPLVRIQAIESLSPEQQQDKTILHELAFNDEDSRVTVAALNKLNNFDLWWKASDTAKDLRVAKHARQKVESALLKQNDIKLSDSQKRSFIVECRSVDLLDTLLQKKAIDESDTELMLSVLAKLNKPQQKLRYILNSSNETLQTTLFDEIRAESELNKVIKKSSNENLVEKAKARLEAIEEEKQKPITLTKDVKLVLAKLLALVDESDFEKLTTVKDDLIEKFNGMSAQFSVLEDEISDQFNQKFADIEKKLEKKLAIAKEQWDAKKEIERTSEALKQAQTTCEQVLQRVGDALTNHVEKITLGELETFNNDINEAQESLSGMLSSNLSEQEHRGIEKFINQLLASKSSLETLPALQTAITQAKETLEQFKALPLPDDDSQIEAAQQYLDEVKSRWKEVSEPYKAIWPKSLADAWKGQVSEWHKAIKQLRDNLYQKSGEIRGRLNGIGRLVDSGRYRNAIRNYEHVKEEFFKLPENQQARLSRQFEKIKDQIENLKDWQAYIATPRKPEILRDIEQLVLNPLEPKQQAERVKELRREWNNLGKVESEADEAMNHAFDLACEEAFKPCREYYADLEKQREENLNSKNELLEQLSVADEKDIKSLAKNLKDMQQKWKAIGGVDFKALDELNKRYQEIVNPIKDKVNEYYRENAELKKQLLQKVEALSRVEDWKQATEEAKKLQEKWRKIDFAGQKLENKLWSDFRRFNDAIFAKRDEAINAQNETVNSEIEAIMVEVDSAESSIAEAHSRAVLETVLNESLKPGFEKLLSMPKKLNAEALAKVKSAIKKAEEKLLYLGDSERSEQYENVFAVLEAWKGDVPEGSSELPNFWRQAFYTAAMDEEGLMAFSRSQLTIVMELQRGIESPEVSTEEKSEVQLQLMASKLQDGISHDLDELLRSWIMKGPLQESDLSLLPRVKACFL